MAITCNGRATFYASIYPDLKEKATQHGWALALHGSLQSDMDIVAIAWDEEASSVETMIDALLTCFEGNGFNEISRVPHTDKPNNRVVYTIHIYSNMYLDINVIKGNYKHG